MKKGKALMLVVLLVFTGCKNKNTADPIDNVIEEMIVDQETVVASLETDSVSELPIKIESIEYVYAKESYEQDKLSIKVRNILDESLKSINLYASYLDESGDITETRYPNSNAKIEPGQAIYLEIEFWDGVPYQICIANGYYSTSTKQYIEFYLDEPIYFDCVAASEAKAQETEPKQQEGHEDHKHILGEWIIVSQIDSDGQGRMAQCCTICDVVLNYKTVDFSKDAEMETTVKDSIAWKKASEIFQTYMNELPPEYDITFIIVDSFALATVYSENGEELAVLNFIDKDGNPLSMDSEKAVYLVSAYLNVEAGHSADIEKLVTILMQLSMPNLTEEQATFLFAGLKCDLVNSNADEGVYPYWGNEEIMFVLMEQGANILLFHAAFSLDY